MVSQAPDFAPPPGPSPGVGVALGLGGLIFTFVAFAVGYSTAWSGTVAAIASGGLLGLTVVATVAGSALAIKRRLRLVPAIAIGLGTAIAGALVLPPLSRADKRSAEEALWNQLCESEKQGRINPYEWDRYESTIPAPFQRPGRV